MGQKSIISINSIMLYVIAFLLTTIFHEVAHALSGAYYDSNAILHHNYVEHTSDSMDVTQRIIVALAGPIISLIQGILAGIIFIRSKKRGLINLLLLWLSILGLNNFFGYLMTGPIFKNGDIGKVYQLAEFPLWLEIIIAILATASITFVAYKLTRPFLEFSFKEEWLADAKSKNNFNLHIIIVPWLIGSAIITLLYMPIIAIVSIIYPIMSGMIFIFPWQNAQSKENISISKQNKIGTFSLPILFVLLTFIFIFKFYLAPGIAVTF